ncbi:MAG: 5-bromo-4-chloroindolyl phosphate hydrolysis family protein [Erysipelotrichaceae bacterium]|nr:5-bromo-4-chloroindolyl phosphate hydrolysis family protein [Erysipelotrichaceae bacterium]
MSYRNNNNNKEKYRWLPWAMIFFGIFSGTFPLAIVGGIWAYINYRDEQNEVATANRNRSNRYNAASGKGPYSSEQLQRVNTKLKKYFAENVSLPIMNDVNLRLRANTYTTLTSLIVYRGDQYICSLNEFGTKYPDMYNQIVKLLIAFADLPDEQVVLKKEDLPTAKADETVTTTRQESPAPKFIQQVNDLNTAIPDEEITQNLYETAALLKQISVIEEKFPESRSKLEKLYSYYMPILIDILNQYKDLQNAQMDANFKATQERLRKTITLINDAMKTLTASLTEEDFINLKADMSTLESLLQQDGLTNDNKITLKL